MNTPDWNTVYITIEDYTPDIFGRQHFWGQWMSNTIGRQKNEIGLQGQFFFGDLNSHIKNWESSGKKIEFIKRIL